MDFNVITNPRRLNKCSTPDAAGNTQTMSSSNARWRVDDVRLRCGEPAGIGAGCVRHDDVQLRCSGNLAGYVYPNGVSTGYGNDNLNRLTSMQSTCGATAK